MTDNEIITLFFQRSEEALSLTDAKYGALARSIARSVLDDRQDCEECVSDSYLKLWQTIPPHRPRSLKAYLGKLVRTTALDVYRYRHREKRFSREISLISAELEDIPIYAAPEERILLSSLLNDFLASLSARDRLIFLRRYWYFDSISQIACGLKLPENTVKTILYKLRHRLKQRLEQEGVEV